MDIDDMQKTFTLFLLVFVLLCSCHSSINHKEECEVKVHLSRDPESLNPLNYNSGYAFKVLSLAFQSLLAYDSNEERIVPYLAKSLPELEEQDDTIIYHYEIRQEAKWDNGNPLSGKDIDFSLKLLNVPFIESHRRRNTFSFIKEVDLHQKNKNSFSLICTKGDNFQMMLTGDFLVLPQYIFDPENILEKYKLSQLRKGEFSEKEKEELLKLAERFNGPECSFYVENIIGSGPYQIDSWESGRFIKLRKKENWWGKEVKDSLYVFDAKPHLINFQIINEPITALLALKNGELDAMEDMLTEDFLDLQSSSLAKEFNFFNPGSYRFTYVGFNSRKEKFNKLTRKALAHLVNYDQIIDVTQQKFAQRTVAIVPPWEKNNYNGNIELYDYNVEKAVRLLKEAGWSRNKGKWTKKVNGKTETLSLELAFATGNKDFEMIALLLKDEAEKIGINVILYPIEGTALTEKLKNHKFDVFIRALGGSPFATNYYGILHTDMAVKGGSNYTGFGNHESDSLIMEIAYAKNAEDKKKYLLRFQEILHEEASILFLYYAQNKIVINKKYANVKISTFNPAYHLPSFTYSPKKDD